MAAKDWVDIQDFRTALAVARERWPRERLAKRCAAAPRNPPPRPGTLVACTDTIADSSHAIMGQVRSTRCSSFVEVCRSGSSGLRHLPSDQTFAVDVRELRGLTRVLRQAEASAVRHGLLDSVGA